MKKKTKDRLNKSVKDIIVSWNWSGDEFNLKGFKIAIMPEKENPNDYATSNLVVASEIVGKNIREHSFKDLILENGKTYVAWVQSLYGDKDSPWVSNAKVEIEDDGQATMVSLKNLTDFQDGLKKELEEITAGVSETGTYLDNLFMDNIINAAEAKAINERLAQLDKEYETIQIRYNSLINNQDLIPLSKDKEHNSENIPTVKEKLIRQYQIINGQEEGSYNYLISKIKEAIVDGRVNSVEKRIIDTAFAKYKESLAKLSTLFEEGLDVIAQTKATRAEINAINYYDKDIADNIQPQIDTKIESYFQDTNPATAWNDRDKKLHIGDLWYDRETKVLKRYREDEGVYSWEVVRDAKVNQAYDAAAKAQSTADAKIQMFTTEPSPPYDKGDLWKDNTNSNDLKICVQKKTGKQIFAENDWIYLTSNEDKFKEIKGELDILFADNKLTLLEARSLSNSFAEINIPNKSDNLVIQAKALKISAELAAYTRAKGVLNDHLTGLINLEKDKYPVKIDANKRRNIKTALSNFNNAKNGLLNQIIGKSMEDMAADITAEMERRGLGEDGYDLGEKGISTGNITISGEGIWSYADNDPENKQAGFGVDGKFICGGGAVTGDQHGLKIVENNGDYSVLGADGLEFYKKDAATPYKYVGQVASGVAQSGDYIELKDKTGVPWKHKPKVITTIKSFRSYNFNFNDVNQNYESFALTPTKEGFYVYGHSIIPQLSKTKAINQNLTKGTWVSPPSSEKFSKILLNLTEFPSRDSGGGTSGPSWYSLSYDYVYSFYYKKKSDSKWVFHQRLHRHYYSGIKYNYPSNPYGSNSISVAFDEKGFYQIKVDCICCNSGYIRLDNWGKSTDSIIPNGEIMWLAIEGGAD